MLTMLTCLLMAAAPEFPDFVVGAPRTGVTETTTTPTPGSYQELVLSQSPEVYYPMDDAVGAYRIADLIKGIWTYPVWDAQLSLGAPGIPAGGTAWEYNGDGVGPSRYYQIGQHKRTNIVNSPLSIASWFKSDIPTNHDVQTIVAKVGAYDHDSWDNPWAGGGYSMGLRYFSGTAVGAVCLGGIYDCDEVNGATFVTPYVWHHIAMTYDGSTLRIYLDGELDGQVAARSGLPGENNGPLRIGASTAREFWCDQYPTDPYCFIAPFHGALAHLALWRRALAPAEILAQYNRGMGIATAVEPAPIHSIFQTLFRLPEVRERTDFYDVSGRRVKMDRPGVYFVSGRRVVVVP